MSAPPSVTFQGTLAPADLATAIGRATRRSWLHRLLTGWFLLLAIAIAANATWSGQTGSWAGIIVPLAFVGWLLGGAGIQARSQFRQHKHIGEPGTYEFDRAGFRISRPSLEVKVPWPAVSRVLESADQYLIYTSPNCFHVIPRCFLSDEQKWRELVAAGYGRSVEKV